MGRLTNGTAICALTALVGLSWLASDASARMVSGGGREPSRRSGPPILELVFEGGLAEPLGAQGDPFGSDGGLGAATGYELGLRLRQHLTGHLSVAPTFHYVDFGEARGVGDFPEGNNLGYRVATSLFRYGLDMQLMLGDPQAPLRPFITGGASLSHNRYHDSLQYHQDFETSMNGPCLTAGFGFKMLAIELTANYFWNRFETANLTGGRETLQYNWDYAVVRVGFAFGAN